jgi:phage tail-like protein
MGQVRNAHAPGKFRIEVDGYDSQNFEYAGPFDMDVEEMVHMVGPNLVPVKEPTGKVTVPDLELRRPQNNNNDLYNWFKETVDAATGRGEVPDNLKRTVDVVQMDNAGNDIKVWRNYGCFAKGYRGGENDVEATTAKKESVILSREFFERLDV